MLALSMPFSPSSFVPPLRKLRRDSGLTPQQIIDKGRALTDQFPSSLEALSVIEVRGTRNHDLILAFATIYDKTIEESSKASRRPEKTTVES